MLSDLATFCVRIFGKDRSEKIVNRINSSFEHATITRHPYGFYIINADNDSDNHALRVHVWLAESRLRQEPDWPPHTHNSPLHSFVVGGEAQNFLYSWLEDPDGDKKIYEVGYNGKNSTLSKTSKRGRLVEKSAEKLTAGEFYSVPRQTFHVTSVLESHVTVTIVLLDRNMSGASLVAGSLNGQKYYYFDRAAIDEARKIRVRSTIKNVMKVFG